ncbi:homeobox domain protein [Necator americanus]|uniref:Homeobox domain protein n=1 Tax=Necator americanus TaxID=51031 RepID=W2TRE3_NECAM|nr:homeobox domain protein [Necator americanus]ETN84353.1 homeobox domain protein [Necator americanus]
METSSCSYPVTGIFDEIPWMSMPPPYYAYPISATGQPGYSVPMTMPHSIAYPSAQVGGKYKKKRNLFTKLQLNMLQRRFAEKEHIRQPERDSFAHMIGLTGEQVKIWFQNQRYKRKHREYGTRDAGTTSSSGANTSVSSLSSPSPDELPDAKLPTNFREVPVAQQTTNNIPCSEITFEQSNYSQLYWSQQAAYYPPLNFSAQGFNTSPEEKLSLSTCSEDDLDM